MGARMIPGLRPGLITLDPCFRRGDGKRRGSREEEGVARRGSGDGRDEVEAGASSPPSFLRPRKPEARERPAPPSFLRKQEPRALTRRTV